jgi:hypothetical protein
MALSLPSSILIKSLQVSDEWYNAGQMRQDELLFYGGSKFKKYIEEEEQEFLLQRLAEKENDANFNGAELFAERKKIAFYVERGPAIMKDFKYLVVKAKPKITVNLETEEQPGQQIQQAGPQGVMMPMAVPMPPVPIEDPRSEYWESLNDNCDGLGGNLCSETEKLLEQIILHGAGYLTVVFDKYESKSTEAGSKDAWIRNLPTKYIDRQGRDKNDRLTWIRTYKKTVEYINEYSDEKIENHLWTYITNTQIIEYRASKKETEEFKPNELAIGTETKHDFGALPIFEVRASNDCWLMEHLRAPMLALYNCETDLRWLLRCNCYPTFVLNLESGEVSKVIGHELQGLRLGVNEKASYVGPPATPAEMLFKQKDELIKALNDVINSFPLNLAPQQTQNPRATTGGKMIDRIGMISFLESTALYVKDAWKATIKALQEYRGEEDLDIEMQGLEDYAGVMMNNAGMGGELESGVATPEDQQVINSDTPADSTMGGTANKDQRAQNKQYQTARVLKGINGPKIKGPFGF